MKLPKLINQTGTEVGKVSPFQAPVAVGTALAFAFKLKVLTY